MIRLQWGPKRPSKGKTNSYILGTNKKKNVHIQVANLDNKKYELNMYMESAMEEGRKPVSQMTPAEKKKDAERRKAYKSYQKGKRNEEVLDEDFDLNLFLENARAKRDAMRSMGKRGKDAADDDEFVASDDDRKSCIEECSDANQKGI